MAKSKRAAALFEVIHSGKDADRTLLNTPRWWFKKDKKSAGTTGAAIAAASPASPSSAAVEHDPTAGTHSLSAQEIDRTPEPSHTPNRSHQTNGARERKGGANHGPNVAVDRERQVITFKFSFTSAVVMGFAIVVAVALAYIIGQKMSRGPSPAIAGQTTEQLRAGKANPDVLNLSNVRGDPSPKVAERDPDDGTVSRGPDTNPDNVIDPRTGTPGTGTPGTGTTGTAAPGTGGAANLPVAPPAANGKRTVNLNYVVMQSYPEEKSAIEARDALIKAGIGCTIEQQKFRGLNPDWYTVIGTQAFERARGPEYDAYIRKILGVSEQYSKNKKSFKAFSPLAYKWDKQ